MILQFIQFFLYHICLFTLQKENYQMKVLIDLHDFFSISDLSLMVNGIALMIKMYLW